MPIRDLRSRESHLDEVLESLESAGCKADISRILARLVEISGLKSAAYLGVSLNRKTETLPYLAVTYSSEWIDRYKSQHFLKVDPTIQIGLRRILPIDWNDFDQNDKNVKRLFGEAREHGLGRQGLSLPVHGPFGDRALFSITTDMSSQDWQYFVVEFIRDFQVLALHLHQTIMQCEGEQPATQVPLSPRERECLQWVAEGKTSWECAMILGLAERTVRFYLESARHKLGAANTTHAVSKARKASLLSPLP